MGGAGVDTGSGVDTQKPALLGAGLRLESALSELTTADLVRTASPNSPRPPGRMHIRGLP